MDLMVAVSCGLTSQICLIIALSFPLQTLEAGLWYWPGFHWHGAFALRTHVLYTRPRGLERKVAGKRELVSAP